MTRCRPFECCTFPLLVIRDVLLPYTGVQPHVLPAARTHACQDKVLLPVVQKGDYPQQGSAVPEWGRFSKRR